MKGKRTLSFAGALVVLGAVQLYLPGLTAMLGDYHGLVTLAVGVTVAYLRYITTTPMGKGDE